jgi:hypothetical protein
MFLNRYTNLQYKNEFFKEHLQSTIIPQLLAESVIKPNKQKIVEGETLLERAQNALNMLRKEVSAERLVWRVSDQGINEHGSLWENAAIFGNHSFNFNWINTRIRLSTPEHIFIKVVQARPHAQFLLPSQVYAINLVGVFAIAEVELAAVPATCIAKTPPKGPAGLGLANFTRHTPDCPPTVPVQVVPAGIATEKGYGLMVSFCGRWMEWRSLT